MLNRKLNNPEHTGTDCISTLTPEFLNTVSSLSSRSNSQANSLVRYTLAASLRLRLIIYLFLAYCGTPLLSILPSAASSKTIVDPESLKFAFNGAIQTNRI
jgi:hypothetical protein